VFSSLEVPDEEVFAPENSSSPAADNVNTELFNLMFIGPYIIVIIEE